MNEQFDNFIKAYKNAPQTMKDLIDSEEIGLFIDLTLVDNQNSDLKHKLLVIISNNLLRVSDNNKLQDELQSLHLPNPADLDKIKQFINTKLAETDELAEKLEATKLNDTIETAQEIIEAEAALETISPIRTMAGDSNQKEQVYTTHQSAILSEGK